MARKLRLEYPGAIYHVINRGNYRGDVFAGEKTKAAFESCLFEACARAQWVLHAFVVMRNHFHLALETPEANLAAGMQWLLATFAARFNRFRGERGHLFQGRYKALVVDAGTALGAVCDYIHLNPVRAGIVTPQSLDSYRYSSYWYLNRPKLRPPLLRVQTALEQAGDLADRPAGWAAYAAYLGWQAADGPAGKNAAYVNLSRGWALGSEAFKAELIQDHPLAAEARALESDGAQEVRQARWQLALQRVLRKLPASARKAADASQQNAGWKVAVAAHLKATTDASNPWLAEQLQMGSGKYVSKLVGQLRQGSPVGAAWLRVLEKGKGTT